MKNKFIAVILITALLLTMLPLTAFAANDDGSGFNLFDILDGIGGFFRDIGNNLSDGFNKTVTAIKTGISYIADGIGKIISSIGNAVAALLDGLKRLFVPSKDYFPRAQEQLQNAINKKLGGILSLIGYIKTRFSNLSAAPNSSSMFVIEFPNGHMFAGTKIDLLMRIRNIIPLFRFLLSGLMVIATTVFSYRRVKSMINT